jgi:hypothetical protein
MGLWQGKYLIVRRDGTSPAWNNLAFVLGPRDPHAAAAIMGYVESMMKEKGHDEAYCKALLELASSYDDYQKEHGEGDPTAPPWRAEAHDVMTALQGDTSVVVVFPDKDNKKTKPPKD